jgi:hypothetical protein
MTKNVARLVIDTAGRVAIGMNTPAARLHVNTSATTPPLLLQINGTTKLLAGTNGGLTIGSNFSAPANGLFVVGNVGIGTNVPFRKLQVQDGDIRLQTSTGVKRYLEFVNTSGTTPDWRWEHAFHGQTIYLSSSPDDFSNFFDRAYYEHTSSTYAYTVNGKARAHSWDIFSDGKLKNNVSDLTDAMNIISKLKPKTYNFKQGEYAGLGFPKQKQYGLIAQELEVLLPELVSTSPMPVRTGSNGERIREDVKSVNYTALIPLLIKATQEQQQENAALKVENKSQQKQIDELCQVVVELKNGRTGSVTVTSAYLEQNSPNPVNGSTVIRYSIPETSTLARLVLTNAKGQVVKAVSLGNGGAGQVNLTTSMLATGIYTYSFWVGGKQVDSKRLVIAR